MPVTRSTAAERAQSRQTSVLTRGFARNAELVWLIGASLVIGVALWLVYQAKMQPLATTPAPLNLNQVDRREQLLTSLSVFPQAADRAFAQRKLYDFLADQGGHIPNVGTLARARVTEREIANTPKLVQFRARLSKPIQPERTVPLLTGAQLAALKGQWTVRERAVYQRTLWGWSAAFFAVFSLVHIGWRVRGFTGAQVVLPAVLLLTGMGYTLMISLRDPLRDSLSFVNFAQGTVLGVAVMGVLSFLDFRRLLSGYSFVPLGGAVLLSLALILFGSGPGASDAKVNLLGTQPVEGIKILLVFFLAGYFARRWELLRELQEVRPVLGRFSEFFAVPRLEYVLPVLAGVGLVLLFFFFQKDLGPALVFASVFLTLYAVARRRAVLAVGGLLLLMGGFGVGYWLGHPHTVRERVQMWLSPWDNSIRGGDQVVQALWAMSAGGPTGTGLGLGDPAIIPAGHTDLVLAALGEEWGFVGTAVVFLVYGGLLAWAIGVARRARDDYSFFLALGLALLLAGETLLIAGGVLDLVPLSGVVTPFLSYGRSSMIANCAVLAILLSLSRRAPGAPVTQPFALPLRWVTGLLAVAALAIVGKAAYVQIARADATTGTGALVVQADGARRYQYNPRLLAIARPIPRGSIYDRRGLPLATSRWEELEQNRAQYAQLGIDIDRVCQKSDSRHYPLGEAAFHLLGDLRTRANWTATNSSLQERDSAVRLQGYDDRARVVRVPDLKTGAATFTIRYDYRELLPLLRHRYEPDDPTVQRLRQRSRDVRMSIDARLQLQATAALRRGLQLAKQDRGAAVILDAETGDLLASVSLPAPVATGNVVMADESHASELLDRARYGLYPPGSTFKIVTAMAGLRGNPALAQQTYSCVGLPDGRVGNYVGSSKRPIRDDPADRTPHGAINLAQAITVSCNAYFAQFGTYKVGPQALLQTAELLGIAVARPATVVALKQALPQASYGQGQVVASPLQMARVAATIANAGQMPFGRWVVDETNQRVQGPVPVVSPQVANVIGQDMRLVVTNGTGKRVASVGVPIAGKTGTAELADAPSHSWFIGYAPHGVPQSRRLAFAVLVENGQYGGTVAAPIAGELVLAAQRLGLLQKGESH